MCIYFLAANVVAADDGVNDGNNIKTEVKNEENVICIDSDDDDDDVIFVGMEKLQLASDVKKEP